MGWFGFKTKRERQLEEQLRVARGEASRNWEAKIVAENESSDARKAKEEAEGLLKTCREHRDNALKEAEKKTESLNAMSARVETLKNERNTERKAKRGVAKERDKYKAEVDALKVDQREKDALCNEKNELLQQVSDLEAEVEKCREGAEVAAAEKRSLIADRDGWKEDHDKLNTQNGQLHQRIKTLQSEKESQRVELARIRDKECARPIIQVEIKEGVQGTKAVPCYRYRAMNGFEGPVVAVSAPQGVPDRDKVEKRIGLLSDARWVIYKVVDKDGKVTYPKEGNDG